MKRQPIQTEEEVELSPEELDDLPMQSNAASTLTRRSHAVSTQFGTENENKTMSEHAIEKKNTFDLSPEEEADLEAAIAEADAGLLVPLEEVLRRMHETSDATH